MISLMYDVCSMCMYLHVCVYMESRKKGPEHLFLALSPTILFFFSLVSLRIHGVAGSMFHEGE
jgi:hypothetical protein